jgi:hypothetical protein
MAPPRSHRSYTRAIASWAASSASARLPVSRYSARTSRAYSDWKNASKLGASLSRSDTGDGLSCVIHLHEVTRGVNCCAQLRLTAPSTAGGSPGATH